MQPIADISWNEGSYASRGHHFSPPTMARLAKALALSVVISVRLPIFAFSICPAEIRAYVFVRQIPYKRQNSAIEISTGSVSILVLLNPWLYASGCARFRTPRRGCIRCYPQQSAAIPASILQICACGLQKFEYFLRRFEHRPFGGNIAPFDRHAISYFFN